jgi:TatD DNase family protein
MRLFDTHCHLDLYPDYTRLIEEIEKTQIYTIAVTNTPSVFRRCQALTEKSRFIRAALGLHPQLVSERHKELGLMYELLGQTKYIGEVGLDFVTQDKKEKGLQQRVFTSILERCASGDKKIFTIHSRRAAAEVTEIIGDSYPGVIILHWFSGTLKELDKAISFGFYFSVNPAMVMGAKGRQLLTAIPRDKILTESDGPFTKVGGRPSRPIDIDCVVSGLADVWKVTRDQAAEVLYVNFRRILTQEYSKKGD